MAWGGCWSIIAPWLGVRSPLTISTTLPCSTPSFCAWKPGTTWSTLSELLTKLRPSRASVRNMTSAKQFDR